MALPESMSSQNNSQGKESLRSPLYSCLAGVSAALLLLAVESLGLLFLGGPLRPAEAFLGALPLMLVAGAILGVAGLLFGRGAGASERARLGIPLSLLGSLLLSFHLRDYFLGQSVGVMSAPSLVVFGVTGAVGVTVAVIFARTSKPNSEPNSEPNSGPKSGQRSILALALSSVFAGIVWLFLCTAQPEGSSGSGPNVVLVVFDTTRVDRLSAFGYERETTPNLTRFASEGALFTRCYSAAPWTVPSHASMFTGVQTSTHRATRRSPILDQRLVTLAERMRASGLRTVSFSKKSWLRRETGLMRGFDELHDLYNPPRKHGLTTLMGLFRKETKVLDKGATETLRVATEWLDDHGDEGRFFAFFNFNEAHSDLRPPRRYREQFLSDEYKPTQWGHARVPENHAFSVGEVSYGAEDLAILSDLYDAEIAYQDARFGELLDAFQAAGQLDNTLFLVTADHGENLGEEGLLGHELSLHNNLLHVPLVARFPGRIPAGIRSDEPVENRLVGTLIESLLVGSGNLEEPELASLLQDDKFDGIISEEFPPSFQSRKWGFEVDERFDVERKSLISGSMKLQFTSIQERPALFNLLEDSAEGIDLAESRAEEARLLFDRLLSRPDLWKKFAGSSGQFSDEMKNLLQATGYY
ncbi:MAG: arylsulfatase A-like enzyme [Planctomycetota bacterium]|jgi:arylsulfatase A-like enzyme